MEYAHTGMSPRVLGLGSDPINSKPWSKACREKSAEVIVPANDSGREGLNPTEVYNQ